MTLRRTKKHRLALNKTLPYFLDHIKCGKTLSERVFEKIDFTRGSFFTILPCTALFDKLFDFNNGGIIPSVLSSEEGYWVKGQSEQFYPKKIITMDQECSEFIASFLSKNYENLAVVENYMLDPQSPYVHLENVKMIPFNSEVYYFLNKNNSVYEICQTIRRSNQVWHFLAVLTRMKDAIPPILTDLIIDQICENIRFVIAGAYDGEGYVFWRQKKAD